MTGCKKIESRPKPPNCDESNFPLTVALIDLSNMAGNKPPQSPDPIRSVENYQGLDCPPQWLDLNTHVPETREKVSLLLFTDTLKSVCFHFFMLRM